MGIARRLLGPAFRVLPLRVRRELRTRRLEAIVRRGGFESDEFEYGLLSNWLSVGDMAFDIGANFGTYSLRMSALVGLTGRVFAFEPVPQTFAVLTRVLSAAGCRNVTALNLACSDRAQIGTMSIPDDALTGEDLYRAALSSEGVADTRVCCVRVDDIRLPVARLKVVKIDAETHEPRVIAGMWDTICGHRPILIVEHLPTDVSNRLAEIGYERVHKEGSPNSYFLPSRT